MIDDKVMVSRDLLESALACVASHNTSNWSSELKAALVTALAQPSDGALTNEGAEPVAWAVFTDKGHIRIWSSDCTAVGLRVEAEEGRPAVPLYRRPPAPASAVLPERRPESYSRSVGLVPFHEGWNACLDELKRLTPTL